MKLINDTRTWTIGLVVDAIAPGLTATDRATFENRAARWTREGILKVEGPKYAGRGHHHRYPAAEIALLAVAETLHQRRLQIAAIENVIVALRSQLTDTPGANPIDLAVDAVNGYTVDPHKTSIALIWTPNEPGGAQVVARYCDLGELAQHPMSVNLCLHHILKPLASMFSSQGARAGWGRKYRLDN